MIHLLLSAWLSLCATLFQPGLTPSPYFNEQEICFVRYPDMKIRINAPAVEALDPAKPTRLVLYALPNGNSTDWTVGKLPAQGDDWHYHIQHIGAQTRFVRRADPSHNYITVYLESATKSWGSWRKGGPGRDALIKETVEYLMDLFAEYHPLVELNSHSGGGNFLFGFMDACSEIPSYVKRIAFLDSDYNWDDRRYGPKLARWLQASDEHALFVACYDDANALYEGKPFVSKKGGTWYRTYLMNRYLKKHLKGVRWQKSKSDSTLCSRTREGRVQFYFRKNPERKIYHTVLVERNGFIQSLLSATPLEEQGYHFMGAHAYDHLRQDSLPLPRLFLIPPRERNALGGTEFVRLTATLTAAERDSLALEQWSRGNVPSWLRRSFLLKDTLCDARDASHEVIFRILPDVLAIGDDNDYLRLPLLPATAQRVASAYGAMLPTRRLSDLIHRHCPVKLQPHPMTPDATMTTLPVFVAHDALIREALQQVGARPGQPVAGHKKDIVLTNRMATETGRLFIYGWHYPDGKAIQPLSAAHHSGYVDYSHGVRLVCDEVWVDGRLHSLRSLLADPVLYALVSDESGPLEGEAGYPLPLR